MAHLTPEQEKMAPALIPPAQQVYPIISISGSALAGLIRRTVARSPDDREWTATMSVEGKYYRLTLVELDADAARVGRV